MAIKKRLGRDKADKAVIAIEGLKAVLRLAIMKTTEGRTSVQPPIAEREFDPSVLDLHKPHLVDQAGHTKLSFAPTGPAPRSTADVLLGKDGQRVGGIGGDEAEEEVQQEYWKGARTGYARPTIASLRGARDPALGDATARDGKDSVKEYLLTRVLTVEDVKRPQDLVNKAKGLKRLAEIIWILRPLIYGAFPYSPPSSLPADFLATPPSPLHAQMGSPTHPPLPPLPLPRVPRFLPPSILYPATLHGQGVRSHAPSLAQRGREAGDEEEGEGVLVVHAERTRLGELD